MNPKSELQKIGVDTNYKWDANSENKPTGITPVFEGKPAIKVGGLAQLSDAVCIFPSESLKKTNTIVAVGSGPSAHDEEHSSAISGSLNGEFVCFVKTETAIGNYRRARGFEMQNEQGNAVVPPEKAAKVVFFFSEDDLSPRCWEAQISVNNFNDGRVLFFEKPENPADSVSLKECQASAGAIIERATTDEDARRIAGKVSGWRVSTIIGNGVSLADGVVTADTKFVNPAIGDTVPLSAFREFNGGSDQFDTMSLGPRFIQEQGAVVMAINSDQALNRYDFDFRGGVYVSSMGTNGPDHILRVSFQTSAEGLNDKFNIGWTTVDLRLPGGDSMHVIESMRENPMLAMNIVATKFPDLLLDRGTRLIEKVVEVSSDGKTYPHKVQAQ